jgi:hypothetical protein
VIELASAGVLMWVCRSSCDIDKYSQSKPSARLAVFGGALLFVFGGLRDGQRPVLRSICKEWARPAWLKCPVLDRICGDDVPTVAEASAYRLQQTCAKSSARARPVMLDVVLSDRIFAKVRHAMWRDGSDLRFTAPKADRAVTVAPKLIRVAA